VRARVGRRHPELLLAEARKRRASLRVAGPAAFTFLDDDDQIVRVELDPETMHVTSAEWLSYDPLLGDLTLEVRFGWAEGEPVTYRQFENGRMVTDLRYRDVRRGARAAAPPTDIPEEYKTAAAVSAPAEVELVPLGENVHLIRNAGGRDYHSLLVRFADHLTVIEAPFSEDAARRAMEAVRAKYPDLPIRDVVVTHHHYDHIGGIRAYAEAGARIITTAGNVPYLRALLAAPHTIGPASSSAGSVVVAVSTGHRNADAANELVLLDAGPTDHVAEILVAWLPRQKVLFQGDLFRHDPGTEEAARPAAVRLMEMIRERNLDVRTIAGVHGQPATPANLRTAIERKIR
jgi:glyoxylase-like metal-dependent hydrolase (beta-lactamase superfamily II)